MPTLVRENQRKIADMISLLYKAPRTAREISDLTGLHRSNIVAWLSAFVDEGLVKKAGWRNSDAGIAGRLYEWSK